MAVIETYAPIFNGFYETGFGLEFEYDDLIDNSIENISNEMTDLLKELLHSKHYSLINEDYKQYEKDFGVILCQWVEEKLAEIDLDCKVEFQEVVSPKYYNFTNDSINIKIHCENGFIGKIKKIINENIDKFEDYIKNNYTSYDGFCSFYSNDFNDWLKDDYNSHEIGSLIEFILKIKNDDILMDLRYYMTENITWYGYVSIKDSVINAVNNGDFTKFEKELEKLEYQKTEYIKLMKDKIDIDYNKIDNNIKKHIEDMAKEMFELIED